MPAIKNFMNALFPQTSLFLACFKLGLFILLLPLPVGFLLFRMCKIKLESAIESFALIFLGGTLILTAAYFLIRFLKLEALLSYILMIPVIAGLYFQVLWLSGGKWSAGKLPVKTLSEIGAFSVISAALFFYLFYPNWGGIQWQSDGALILTHGFYSDHIWKLSVISELHHSVPPQMPLCAGHRLAYHYFVELFTVFINHFTQIDYLTLRFYLVPVYAFIFLCAALYSGLKRLFGVSSTALMGLALLFLTDSAQSFSLYSHTSTAVAIFFLLICLLTELAVAPRLGVAFFSWFLISQMMMYESILSLCFIASLGIGSLILFLRERKWIPLLIVAVGGITALLFQIIAIGRLGGGRGLFVLNFPFFQQAIIDFPPAKNAARLFLDTFHHRSGVFDKELWTPVFQLAILTPVSFLLSFLKSFQWGLSALPLLVDRGKKIFRQDYPGLFFVPAAVLTFVFPFFVSLAFFWGGSFRIMLFSALLFYAWSAEVISRIWQKNLFWKIALILSLCGFVLFPALLRIKALETAKVFYTRQSPEAMEIFSYLRTETPEDAVLMHPFIDDPVLNTAKPGRPAWIFEDHYYYASALGGRRVVLEGAKDGPVLQMLQLRLEDILNIRADIQKVYKTISVEEAQSVTDKYNVSYLWSLKSSPLSFPTAHFFEPVVENNLYILYKVIRHP